MKTGLRWAGLAAGLAVCGWAVADSSIYSPNRSIADQGITLQGWGSGNAAETDEFAFEGTSSLRITSRNYFQGGILTYRTPMDLSKESGDAANLILLTIMLPGTTASAGGPGPGGPPMGPGGFPGGMAAGGGARGGGGAPGRGGAGAGGFGAGGFGPGGPGGFGAPGAGGQGSSGLSSVGVDNILRLVLTTSDGKKAEAFVDLRTTLSDAKGWRRVGIPFAAITGWDKTNKTIKSVAFSLNKVGALYVGDASVVKDDTPIYAEPSTRELNLALGDRVTLSAAGFGGATPLKYTWDFDKADGVGADAEGQAVTRRFRKPGEFTVTLTVTDVYGLKAPFTTEIKITVNP